MLFAFNKLNITHKIKSIKQNVVVKMMRRVMHVSKILCQRHKIHKPIMNEQTKVDNLLVFFTFLLLKALSVSNKNERGGHFYKIFIWLSCKMTININTSISVLVLAIILIHTWKAENKLWVSEWDIFPKQLKYLQLHYLGCTVEKEYEIRNLLNIHYMASELYACWLGIIVSVCMCLWIGCPESP